MQKVILCHSTIISKKAFLNINPHVNLDYDADFIVCINQIKTNLEGKQLCFGFTEQIDTMLLFFYLSS